MAISPRHAARVRPLFRNASAEAHQTGRLPDWCPTLSRRGWQTCCSFRAFDVLGSVGCFGRWPSWEVHICCASREGEAQLQHLWRRNFSDWHLRAAWDPLPGGKRTQTFFIVHHKTGHKLVQSLLESPGAMRKHLGWTSARVNGLTLDRPEAALPPFFQSWARQYVAQMGPDSDTEDMWDRSAWMVSNPSFMMPLAVHHGLTRPVHVVRRPSELVVSAYRYHKTCGAATEPWIELMDPPSCLGCDSLAWREIFARCDFACSYEQLLQRSPVREGLQIAALSSRWQVLRMLDFAHEWHDSPMALQVALDRFESNFDQTVRCVTRFVLNEPPPAPPSVDLERLVAEAREISPAAVRQACGGSLVEACTLQQGEAADHMSPLGERRSLRSELRQLMQTSAGWLGALRSADLLLDRLLLHSGTARRFGC